MTARLLAWGTCATAAALAAATAAFALRDDGTRLPGDEGGGTVSALGELSFGVMVIAFCSIGALIASRRPRSPIGWILCVSPLALGVTGVARGWYVHAEYASPGSAPAPAGLLWLANWAWVWGFIPLITALLLLFPDGRLPSPRWRPAAWLVATALATLTLGYALAPGALEDYPRAQNPLGAPGAAGDVFSAFTKLGYPFFAFGAVASAASLVSRFRRSEGEQRQQLKWMAAAAAVVVVAWLVNAVLDQVAGFENAFFLPVALLSLPVAAAIAVLRYRLYDLDLVIRRTLVYGVLTATLAGAYLGCVLLFQLALGPLTRDSGLAVAGSTLAVAALFRPARARIQAAVDRRFYRRRYDAARTLEAFGSRLRDQVDLDAMGADLRGVVGDTMQPAHVSLWLRGPR